MEEKDIKKEPLLDRAEDKLDDVMTGIQDAIYGEPKSVTEDIPRMIEHPSGIRRINKVQTRRNLNRMIFKKPLLKGIAIFLLVVILGFIAYEIIYQLLMK